MIPFIMLPVYLQNTFCFWALLVCLAGMADTMLLLRQRRYILCGTSVLSLLLSYLILHICREGSEFRLKGHALKFVLQLLGRPFIIFLLALTLLSVYCLVTYISVLKWKKTHITSQSIKESLDSLPAGICYYFDGGQCLLVNHRMKDICFFHITL